MLDEACIIKVIDFSGKNALSFPAPAFDEESISLVNTALFHKPGL